MSTIDKDFKIKVREAMLRLRTNFTGSDKAFSNQLEINNAQFSRIKNGEVENIISDGKWISIGRKLQVNINDDDWKIARTEVYDMLEDQFHFCQKNHTSLIFVDECEIGKTVCSQSIVGKMKNAFYIDCSQVKTKRKFIYAIATAVGSGTEGKYEEVLENLKYYLNILENPFIALDEAGDLEFNAFLEIKALQNATVNHCGWFLLGADGLRAKMIKGIDNHKVGYAEIFSRFSGKFLSIVPTDRYQKIDFYKKLIGDVATVNLEDKSKVNYYVNLSIPKFKPTNSKPSKKEDYNDRIRGLRYLRTKILVDRSTDV